MSRHLAWVSLPLLACSAPAIQGAVIVPAGSSPPGESVATYAVSSCTDAAGAAAPWHAELRLLRNSAGEHSLLELRPDQDALLVRRVSVPGQELVFQVVVQDWIREIRFPAPASSSGTMVVARSWRGTPGDGGGAATELEDVVLECTLTSAATPSPASGMQPGAGEAVAPAGESKAKPAPEPSAGPPDPRTGY